MLPRRWAIHLESLPQLYTLLEANSYLRDNHRLSPVPLGWQCEYPSGYATQHLEPHVWASFDLPRADPALRPDDRALAWVGDGVFTNHLRYACLVHSGRVDQRLLDKAASNRTMREFLTRHHRGLLRAFGAVSAGVVRAGTIFEAVYARSAALRDDYWAWLTRQERPMLPAALAAALEASEAAGGGEHAGETKPARATAPTEAPEGLCWTALFDRDQLERTGLSRTPWASRRQLVALTRVAAVRAATFSLTRVGLNDYHVREDPAGVLSPWHVLALLESDEARVGGRERPEHRTAASPAKGLSLRVRARLSSASAATRPARCWRARFVARVLWAALADHLLSLALACAFRRRPAPTPDAEGFCYLALYKPERWQSVARLLGRCPRWRAVAACKPDMLPARVHRAVYGVTHVTSADCSPLAPASARERAAFRAWAERQPYRVGLDLTSFWAHIRRLGELRRPPILREDAVLGDSQLPGPRALRPLDVHGDRRGTFFGVETSPAPAPWGGGICTGSCEPFEGPHLRGSPDFMWRSDLTERGWRDASNQTLHKLAPSFFDHVREPGRLPYNERAATAWDAAARLWMPFARSLPGDAVVVVTAANTAACDATSVPPEELVPGATHGFIFAAARGEGEIAPGWSGCYLEIPDARDRRWLAGLRLLPLVRGRTDVRVVIVNGFNPKGHPLAALGRLVAAHPQLAAVNTRWVPVNLGATAARGCTLEPDYHHIRTSFAELGDVYGWDETVLYVRGATAWVVPEPGSCMPYADGFELENVTWLADQRQWGFRAHTYRRWTVDHMRAHLRGAPLQGDAHHPGYTFGPTFKPLKWVLAERDAYMRQRGIPPLQWGEDARKAERVGSRYTTSIEAYDPDYPELPENFPGNTWRAYDRCWGARCTVDTTVTQSIHPEIWADIQSGSPRPRADLAEIYVAAARRIGRWATAGFKPGEVVGVASVWSRAQAQEFKAARGHLFGRWVFLTEGSEGEEDGDLYVRLPTTFATGFSFQLARLLPGVFSPSECVFSCVNDLETDFLPRALRLEVGLRALERERVVFPAMMLNAPCPFQDVVYRGDAFRDNAASLIATIAKWGWVYGVDEVWAACQDYPTVAVQKRLNNCATSGFKNPVDSRLWFLEGEGIREVVAPGGNFRRAFHERGRWASRAVEPPRWSRLRRALLPWWGAAASAPGVREWSPREWSALGPATVLRLRDAGQKIFTIFTWGTRGDHTPLLAAARQLARAGLMVNLVALCTPEQGRERLALCEQHSAHRLVPELASLAATVAACPGPKIAPDYLVWDGSLAYSLRPAERDATAPRGGLPRAVDWLVSLFFWKERAKVRIGCYRGAKWFPRSADGETFLPQSPVRDPRPERKGRVGGSSTVEPPTDLAAWEEITDVDHFAAFQNFTHVACAGGAGVVQTIAMAGARAVAWSDAIDRRYRQPDNAGAGVDGNEAAEKWWLLAAPEMPSLAFRYCGVSPRRWWHYLKWRAWTGAWLQRAWHVVFMAYSLRFSHVLPTLEETIVGVVLGTSRAHGFLGPLARFAAAVALRGALSHAGVSLPSAVWRSSKAVAAASFSLPAAALTGLGFHPLTAGVVTAAARELAPDWATYGVTWEFGRPLVQGQESGVWLCFLPVYVGGLPLGLHAALWDATTGEKIEGVHVERSRLIGSPFALRRRAVPHWSPFLAIRTSLPPGCLPTRAGEARPYSAIWNCQTMLAGLYIRNAPALVASELVLLVFWSGYAFFWLALFAALATFAGSGATIALWAAAPLERAFPDWQCAAAIRHFHGWVSTMTIGFAADAEEACPATGAPADGAPAGTLDESQGPSPDAASLGEPGSSLRLATATEAELRDAAALLCADAIRAGVDADVAFTAMSTALPEGLLSSERGDQTTFSDVLVSELYRSRRGVTDVPVGLGRDAVTDVAAAIYRAARALRLPIRIVESFAAVAHAAIHGNAGLAADAMVWFARVADWLAENGWLRGARELAADLADRLSRQAPDQLTRRKNAWAILNAKAIHRLRRADWLALSLAPSRLVGEAPGAISEICRRLNEFKPPGEEELDPLVAFRRPAFMPRRPRAAAQETEWPSLLRSVAAQVDPELTARVERYLTLGGRPGLDGIWTATPENIRASVERYVVPTAPLSSADEERARAVASALYDAHPEAFRAPGVVTPETVKSHLVMKYSPGLPFIGRYRTRAELVRTGWMDSIIQATYKCLDEGTYPAQAYHVFPKMMVLDAEKLTSAPGRVRTVIAQDLASVFVDQVVQLERNKRVTWPTTDIGVGAPLTAAYLGRVFERVRGRRHVFNADVTAFDANCPPILYEVLAQLAEMGAQDGGNPVTGSIMRAKYFAMQTADLRLLSTGERLSKVRGGATGQSATSWDNTWAARAAFMLVWSHVTGKPVADFYRWNTIHNTGDDNVWGTDSDLDPDQLARAAESLLGMKLRVEGRDRDGTLSYLSKLPRATSEFADELERHFPGRSFGPTTAIHDASRLLTRRAGVPTHASGMPERSYRRALLERSIGHAMLTWHQPELYTVIAEEWIADAARFFGPRAQKVVFTVARDEAGHITSVAVRPGATATLTPAEEARLRALQKGALKLPTYHKVLAAAYAEPTTKPLSPWQYATVPPSYEAIVRDAIVRARTGFDRWVPDALAKLAPNSGAAPLTQLFHTWGYPVEKFIWRELLAANGDDLEFSEFASAVRNSPYGAACDPPGFWWFATSPGMRSLLLAESRLVVRGRVAAITAWYIALTHVRQALRRTPVLGLVIESLEVYTRDAPKAFAVLNTLYWHERAATSEIISSLLPKDPFATQKQLAACLAACTPDWVCAALGPLTMTGLVGAASEAIAAARRLRLVRGVDSAGAVPRANAWEAHAPRIVAAAERNPAGVLVQAPTATGKSTAFVAALLRERPGSRVWLLLPRIVLRQEYANPWLPEGAIVKLAAGLADTGAPLVVATYGHALARVAGGGGPAASDFVIFDEAHENLPEMGIAFHEMPGRRIIASATPRLLFCEGYDTIVLDLPRPYAAPTPIRLPMDALSLWQEARQTPGVDTSRCLFVLPTLAECDAVRDALLSAGEMATTLTSRARRVAPAGHIVATSIVDTGLTIVPAPTCLIDSGETVASHLGQVRRLATSEATDTQRQGRVGRLAEAAVFTSTKAATGPDPIAVAPFSRLATLRPRVRAALLEAYGARLFLTEVADHGLTPSPLDPFMALNYPARDRSLDASLAALWWLRCESGDVRRAADVYTTLETTGWSEHYEGLHRLLASYAGGAWLAPLSTLQLVLSHGPFWVVEHGVPRRAAFAYYGNGAYRAA